MVVLMGKHLLTPKEREEFRQFQLSQMAPAAPAKPGSGWPYPNQPAHQLGPLGAAVYDSPPAQQNVLKQSILSSFRPRPDLQGLVGQYQGEYSETNPPCFTQTDCHTMATANHLYETEDEHTGLPTYDGDTLEMISAMQKQASNFCATSCTHFCSRCDSLDSTHTCKKIL
jgi:hypothetical protein